MLFRRDSHVQTMLIDITTDDDLTDAPIEMTPQAQMVVHMPAAWTAASIAFKVAPSKTGTYQPLYDDDGNLVQIDSPTANNAYVAPAALAAAHWVKLWSQDGSGSNTAQAADRSLIVTLKA